MKVAIISEWLDPWRGGAETSTLQFVHHLIDSGVDVHVFTRSRPASAPGFTVHTINGAAISRTRRSITFAHRVERRLQRERFDVTHAITPCRGVDLYQPRGGTVAETIERNAAWLRSGAGLWLKKAGNRFNFKQRYMLAYERTILGDAQGPVIVAISNYVVRQLRAHYGISDNRIRLVRNAVNPDESSAEERAAHRRAIRREFGVAESDCLFLVVAHNFRLKGVRRWMEAMRMIRDGGALQVRSLVIGKDDSPTWRRAANRLGIQSALTFVGPTNRVAEFYHAADVLVHPTYYDPCSRVVLEAMSGGLPCIASRWDGASEILTDDRDGLLIDDPNDVAALANTANRLLDQETRKRMGRAASATASQLTMKRHASEIIAIYQEQIDRRGEARPFAGSRIEPVVSGKL